MLVLSRRLHEKIYIGDSIIIEVVDIDRSKIRIGIQAPKETPIMREELLSFAEKKALKVAQEHDLGGEA